MLLLHSWSVTLVTEGCSCVSPDISLKKHRGHIVSLSLDWSLCFWQEVDFSEWLMFLEKLFTSSPEKLLQGLKYFICYCASLQSGFSTAGEWESKSLYLSRCGRLLSYIHNVCIFWFFFLMPYKLSFAICTCLSIKYCVMCILPPSDSFILTVFPSFIIVIFSCVPTSLSKPFCFSHSHRFFVQTLGICSSPFESLSSVRVFSISYLLLLFFLYPQIYLL